MAVGAAGEVGQARAEFGEDAAALGADVARVQGGELDRDAGTGERGIAGGGAADRLDGLAVVVEVAVGVGGGHGAFAQHVVGVAEAARFSGASAVYRLIDGLAKDEMLTHQAHGEIERAADDGLATPLQDGSQRAGEAGLAGGGGERAGHQQAPGGGVDEQRRAAAEMGAPVGAPDAVADQGVAGGGVRGAEQGFGEAHQGDALGARQRVFSHQCLDRATGASGAQGGDQARRDLGDGLLFGRVEAGLV